MRIGEKKRKPRKRPKLLRERWYERGEKHSRQLGLKPYEREWLSRWLRWHRSLVEIEPLDYPDYVPPGTDRVYRGRADLGFGEYVFAQSTRMPAARNDQAKKPDSQ